MTARTGFPDFWWSAQPLIFGHRGASHRAPENTLAAFEAAVDAGADGIELDVHLSADGIPVVIHNARVDATTDGTGRVNAMTVDELKALDAGSHFSAEFAGAQIPTLEEVLAAVGNRLLVNIELKPQSRGIAGLEAAVASLVMRMGLQDRVCISSFKPYMLHTIRGLAGRPRNDVGRGSDVPAVLPVLPSGLLYSPLNLSTLFLIPFTPFEALHPHASLVHRWGVTIAHALGLRIATWTVDDVGAARKLAADGVDVLISNTPGVLVEALRPRP
jgi:glycerophosphoryl diester phosphodiesterase